MRCTIQYKAHNTSKFVP